MSLKTPGTVCIYRMTLQGNWQCLFDDDDGVLLSTARQIGEWNRWFRGMSMNVR